MARPNDVPQDILDQILSRLPVKSLLRFKSVSKSWRCFISSPPFTGNHLRRASSLDPGITALKILISKPDGFRFVDCEPSHFPAAVRLRFPPKVTPDISDHVQLFGSCHGLVCLGVGNPRHLVLWNPSTGDSKTLPDNYDVIPVPAMWNCIGGLGYDPSSDDYKVFLSNNSLFVIFSLRKNSWRRIQLDYGPCVYTNGVYSNGALHWKNYGDGRIFGFDLETERFYLVPGPDLVNNDALYFQRGTLFEVGGERLGVGGFEFWLMKTHGVKESWTRIRNTPEFDEWPRIWNSFKCLLENNDFIVLGGLQQEIITHNANGIGRQIKNTMICDDPIASWCRDWKVRGHRHRREAIAYMESLISPHLSH
ncbi:F-box family protein, putative [Theobroma cacao]|uniref:F-box family protein, putative n=1 Tax=Theobroma cacao TaxID=3641 RepID=A0A061EPL1_THECC|nr:F-box family protein, putative [Theobroma cacao]